MARLSILAGAAALAGCCWGSQPALASGLQVEPVSVTIEDRSGVLWLANTGDAPLHAQIRAYDWSQGSGADDLSPSTTLLASPPMVRLPAGGRQMIRLIGGAAARCEDAFRLSIDELPPAGGPRSGLRYVLRYSVPVFVVQPGCKPRSPALAWRIETDQAGARLTVENSGTMHAQLADLHFVNGHGTSIPLNPGLLGYVLPGARRSFAVNPPPAALTGGGKLEVMVNGQRVTQRVPAG